MSKVPRLGRPPRRSEETTERLRNDITGGRFGQSETLPGERQLAEILQVSRTTLRRALSELIAEGLLAQRQGVGTVINRTAQQPEPGPAEPAYNYRTNGIRISITSVRDLRRGFDEADADEALLLAAAPGTTVYRAVRLLLSDDRPIAIEHEVAHSRFVSSPGPMNGSLIRNLLVDGAQPADAIMRLRGSDLTAEEAGALGIERSTPAVSLQKAIYLSDGRCCAVIRILYPVSALDLIAAGRLG